MGLRAHDGEGVGPLTGAAATVFLQHWAANGAGGVDARRLRADALRAQRGDRAALLRLRSGLRVRTVLVRRPVRSAHATPRPRRSRTSRCAPRARSPGRRSPEAPPPECSRRCADRGLRVERSDWPAECLGRSSTAASVRHWCGISCSAGTGLPRKPRSLAGEWARESIRGVVGRGLTRRRLKSLVLRGSSAIAMCRRLQMPRSSDAV